MTGYAALIILWLASCVFADYVSKSCRQECSITLPCQFGYVCESVGCNSLCRPIKTVLPIKPVDPVIPIGPIDPINTGLIQCIRRCQRSSTCLNGVCDRQDCMRMCQNGIVNPILPVDPILSIDPVDPVVPINPIIPVLPGCQDECNSVLQCKLGAVCVRRGCRQVCEAGVIDPTYHKGCVNECDVDNDCSVNHVCVKRGCGNVCVIKKPISLYQ